MMGPTHGCTKNKCSVNCIQHETTDDSLQKKVEILWNTDRGDLYSDECAMSPLDTGMIFFTIPLRTIFVEITDLG